MMLKVLIKKQFMEIFKGYFFDAKKNQARTRSATVGFFIFYFCMMFIVIGGCMALLGYVMAPAFYAADCGWLYFLLFGGMALMLGLFGSVFSTYSSLYLAKDNEPLLSMPIPVKTIIASRLINVYLLGLIYEASILVPVTIVWFAFSLDFMVFIGGLVFLLGISVIVLLLTCLLGWLVAKISLKIKNRTIIKVLVALLGIGAYYFLYFKAADLIDDLIVNAFLYGSAIKESAFPLYLFGACATGYWPSMLGMLVLSALLLVFCIYFISAGFIRIATSTAQVESAVYKEKRVKERSVFKSLLSREFLHFKSSANYLLNCGMGCIMLPAAGIALLLFKDDLSALPYALTYGRDSVWPVIFMIASGFMSGMNYFCAPSVSLEGRNMWILQSAPIDLKKVIRAKMLTQLILDLPPVLFLDIAAVIVFPISVMDAVMLFASSLALILMYAGFYMLLGIRFANIHWTNEVFPIKQGPAAGLSVLVCFAVPALVFGPGFLAVLVMPLWPFFLLSALLLLFVAWLTYRWCMISGVKIMADL